MSKTLLLFVMKFANSQLFPASNRKNLAYFSFAPVSCKDLKKVNLARLSYIAAIALLVLPYNVLASSINVSTASYKDIAVKIMRTIGGVVPAAEDSEISAQISAIIKKFHVDVGHEVSQGNVLVSLDCREYALKLKQADANLKAERVQLAHAKIQFNQAKKLNKQGNISKELHNQREAEKNRLRATVENKTAAQSLAQLDVERCQIKAPYDGYITKRQASVGELTQMGSHLLQLVSKSNDVVEVKINNRLLNSFSRGENYHFKFNDNSYQLKVDFILPVLDSTTRNHIARLRFTDELAVTGSVGKVEWQDRNASIPSNYIVSRDNKTGLFIVKNNTAQFIEIKNASEGKAATLILDDDTQIITKGRFSVKHGDALKINNP